MDKGFKLVNFRSPEPPKGLFDKIMARIREEERLLPIRRRLFIFSAAVLVSAGALIPLANAFQIDFRQSGLGQFLSLIFSDFGAVVANWQDFGLAILESFPAVSLMAVLAAMLVFLWSIKHFSEALKSFSSRPRLINS